MVDYGSHYFAMSVEEAIEYGQFLEDSGFSRLWYGDSHELFGELYTALTGVAGATETVQLSPGVTNPKSRHPSVTANAISMVNRWSDGRTDLGIGAGDSGVYSIGETPATVDELRDAVSDIQALLAGETVEFGGEPFTLESRSGPVDVYVAAEGPRTLRMAGEVGDGIIFGGGARPDFVEDFGLGNIREGAERANRSLDDLELVALFPACHADTRAAAGEELRHLLEPLAFHNFMYSVEEAPEEHHEELEDLVEAHKMDEHAQPDAERPEYLSDGLLEYLNDRFSVAGPSEHCRERLEALADLGFDEFYLVFPPGVGLDRTIEYAREYEQEVMDPLGV